MTQRSIPLRSTRTPDRGTRPGRAAALALSALAIAALTLSGAAPAAAAGQSDDPTLRVVGERVPEDGTATVAVVLTSAPDGLAGYYLDLSVEGEAVRIDSAGYPDAFGLTTDPAVGSGNRSVTLEAADIDSQVEPGATNVTLATVDLAAVGAGESALTVEPRQFDGDRGGAFDVDAWSGAVAVGSGGDIATPTPAPTGSGAGESGGGSDGDGRDEAADGDSGDPPTADDPADTANDRRATATGTTSGDGPLPTALALAVAVAGLAVAGRRERRR